ncbi:MAG: carbohydrate binding family 9 domain-containing protein [Acidobacteria bacterium]|nr:carbohydrate binding family 9 domain-containing protein [Acidobacteriota bacterium]
MSRIPSICVVATGLAVLCLPSFTYAQQATGARKQAEAVRVAAGAIRVDGRLDESVWRDAPALSDFVQREPEEGAAPTDGMEVRFAYDDTALYVGARMSSMAPIQAPMGRRDEGDQSEHFAVYLDTYLDRRTASAFGVTAAGVRLDEYFATDSDDGDSGYNPVWVARTSMSPQGWTAELWIPFSQLRFTDRSPQVWGLNIKRWIPSRNEEVHWALISRTEQGLASRFGDLQGIEGIRPRRRIELLPYVASGSRVIGNPEPGNPFSSKTNLDGRVGLDAKVGFGSNLTLEATVNPDFGQVEADPAEVNLSAFETFFDERRPFFVEGSNLLNSYDDNWFYSRRIGAPPAGRAAGDFVEYPATTTILGAAKLTGRLPSGTSIGMLAAVTDEESARTFAFPQQFGRVRVAPRTMYGVARVQQEYGPPGSTLGLMVNGAHRDLAEGDPLASLLTRNAVSLSGDSVLRLWDGEYELQSAGGITHVDGDPGAIDRQQRAVARYLQRPDADYVTYDPLRTSMSGAKFGTTFRRRNARHWLWQLATDIESPELEMNDAGRFNTGDGIVGSGRIQYRETVPGRWFRSYSLLFNSRNEWNYGGVRQQAQQTSTVEVTWPNFWTTEVSTVFNPRVQDERLTRGGPSMQKPRSWNSTVELQTSDASRTRGDLTAEYAHNEDGGLTFNINGDLTFQPGSQWQLSIGPEYERQVDTQQYVTTLAGGPAAAFGGRYVFARVDRSTYSTEIRLNYTFKPDLTLDFYGEPFAASGRYDRFGELTAARTRAMRSYGTAGTTLTTLPDGSATVTDGATTFRLANRDFNVQSFRSNLVLRWEWRAGSSLYLVWQQDRALEEMSNTRVTIGDMFGSIGRSGDNFFAIKTSFWFSPR